jgi:peptidoglycan/LPS O-acetylase OafA/YrhL
MAPGPTAVLVTASKPRDTGFYRHDLDGLRGVAIALVAAFHIWFGRVSGGVDVFLALSGFFFGGKLLRAALDPMSALSPMPTLTKMVRRLLPTMVVVLSGCAVLTFLIQPQTRWGAFADQSLASLGYYQNWELSATVGDYLRAGETVSPLQHIWSMSVQGQFYVTLLALVLGLAYLLRKPFGPQLRAVFVVMLGTLTAASFVYAIIVHQADPAAAYYNSFARAWELLIATLAGVLVPYIHWPMWLRTIIAGLSLAAILSCGALIDGMHEFPGPWALWPIGATVLFILTGANRHANSGGGEKLPWPNRMLATKPLVRLGTMAYSLYLWHWPLLIFWFSHTGHHRVTFTEGAVILLVSMVLAYLTARLVEDPLRYPSPVRHTPVVSGTVWQEWLHRPTFALGTAVVLSGVALTSTSFTWQELAGVPHDTILSSLSSYDYPGARALTAHLRVPELPTRPTVLEVGKDLPASTKDGCISDFSSTMVVTCRYGDTEAARTIALAGGSHAEHWLTALDLLGRTHHFAVVTYLKMGCPLSTNEEPVIIGGTLPYPKCHDWVAKTMEKLIADHPEYVFTTSTRPRLTEPGDMVPGTYVGIWQMLSEHGIPTLAMRDTPWMMRDRESFDPADCLSSDGNAGSCGVPRDEALSKRNPTLDFMGRFPLLRPLDMSDSLCRKDMCRAVEGNVLVYRDSHHMSATYNRTMTGELGRQLGAATGWW